MCAVGAPGGGGTHALPQCGDGLQRVLGCPAVPKPQDFVAPETAALHAPAILRGLAAAHLHGIGAAGLTRSFSAA
eukprot:SAG11_NODE_3082_length_2706_cov_18.779056_2_plen_75_part_00